MVSQACSRIVSTVSTLIVAENIRTGEVKFFVSNRVPGRGGWTLRELLLDAGKWKRVSGKRGKNRAGITSNVAAGAACIAT